MGDDFASRSRHGEKVPATPESSTLFLELSFNGNSARFGLLGEGQRSGDERDQAAKNSRSRHRSRSNTYAESNVRYSTIARGFSKSDNRQGKPSLLCPLGFSAVWMRSLKAYLRNSPRTFPYMASWPRIWHWMRRWSLRLGAPYFPLGPISMPVCRSCGLKSCRTFFPSQPKISSRNSR